ALRQLNLTLDITHRAQILRELDAIGRAQARQQALHVVRHRVQQTPLSEQRRTADIRISAVAGPEQTFEDPARIVFHRQRCRLIAPDNPSRVRTPITKSSSSPTL